MSTTKNEEVVAVVTTVVAIPPAEVPKTAVSARRRKSKSWAPALADPEPEAPRCAHCDLPAGVQADGADLGELSEAAEATLAHRGCEAALRVYRPGGLAPFGPAAAAPGALVHVFEVRGDNPMQNEAGRTLRARCGVETRLPGSRIEWTVYVAGHPTACPGCAVPEDPTRTAYPGRLPLEAK